MSPLDMITMTGAVLVLLTAVVAAVVGRRNAALATTAVEGHESGHDNNPLTLDPDGDIDGGQAAGDGSPDVGVTGPDLRAMTCRGGDPDRDYLNDSVATLRRLPDRERERAARQLAAANALTTVIGPVSVVRRYARGMPVSRRAAPPPLCGGGHRLPEGWPS
jgi:hypothetical protein